jgi:mannose-6-phosphate isomerase-like protein (cupin superfamily)
MPLLPADRAPAFTLPGLTVTGLAAPSRGAQALSAWRLRLAPCTPGTPHVVDREEVIVALSGRAEALLDGERLEVRPGDALVVPPGQAFALANPGPEPFEAIAAAPAGLMARLPGGEPFAPPWCR